MTFKEKYEKSKTWYERVMIMEIYHLAMTQKIRSWTLTKTAEHFQVSIGLVSENLRLAHALHNNPKLIEIETRDNALRKLNGH